MEEQINFILKPSLKSLALRKVVTILWDQDHIIDLISRFRVEALQFPSSVHEWYVIVDELTEKITKLSIPETLKNDAIDLIKPLGAEMLKWKIYQCNILSDPNFVRKTLNKVCWTAFGTIDLKKSAEAIVADDSLDASKRYMMACIYCLNKYIPTLWKSIPERDKMRFCYIEDDFEKLKQKELIVFWTNIVKREMYKNKMFKKSPYRYAFEYAAAAGNRIAAEYFFQKVPYSKKERSLRNAVKGLINTRFCTSFNKYVCIPQSYYCEVLCFLLSHMDREGQIKMLESSPFNVLRCFLDWPYQELFINVSHFLWTVLPLSDYNIIVDILIQNRYMYGGSYRELFGQYWQQSPAPFRKQALDHQCSSLASGFLSLLFRIEDVANVRLVLRSLTAEEREQLLLRRAGTSICRELCLNGKWCLIELFIRECKVSKEVTESFRKKFIYDTSMIYTSRSKAPEIKPKTCWQRLIELIDNISNNTDGPQKRCIEHESSTSALRYRGERVLQTIGKRRRCCT